MLFSQATLLLAFAASLVSARPYYKRWDGDATPDAWAGARSRQSNPLKSLFSAIESCDLSTAKMPVAPTPLPAPNAGLSLYQVAVGRGTQNYTCEAGSASAKPVAVGALASLYNVSCMAARSPDLLNALPAIALQLPNPAQGLPFSADLSGHHYFTDPSTPFFNLDTAEHQWGTGAFKKLASSPAPANAMRGQLGVGNGAVPWLSLVAKDPASQKLQQVYRVNTQGGNPPDSCAGQPAQFQVQYAAEYWIYV